MSKGKNMVISTEKCIVVSTIGKEQFFFEDTEILLEEEGSAISIGRITEIFDNGFSFRKNGNLGNFYIPYKNVIKIIDNLY